MRTLLILAALTLNLTAATPLCKIVEGWTRLNERLHQEGVTLGQNLAAKLDGDPSIAASARFQNHPSGLSPRLAAQQEIDEALGAAEEVAPTLIGDLAADAWINTAILQRVVTSSGISYQEMGEGLGYLAQHLPNNHDSKLADILTKNKIVFDNPNRPYLAAGYAEAQMLRDANIVFSNQPNITTNNYVLQLASGSAGDAFELRVAASRKSSGETLEALAADATHGKGVDLVTNQAVYSDKLTIDGVKNAILANGALSPDGELIVQAIIQNDSIGKPYIFAVAEGDPSAATAAFDAINVRLAALNTSPRLTVQANILTVPLSP